MGDRGNIAVIHDKERKEQVWLYSHWGGSELPERLQAGLAAARGRWTDYSYLTKIIFGHAVPVDNWQEETGYGISTCLQDNEQDILVVDCPAQKVFTMAEAELEDRRVPADYVSQAKKTWTFEIFASDEEIIKAIMGAL